MWFRVGFNTLLNIAIYIALASALILLTTARPAFMVLLGALFLVRVPHLYWSIRGRYDSVANYGDMIAFLYPADPSREFVKRVIGLPGDYIQIDRGQVIRNGTPLDESYVVNADTRSFECVRVPPDSIYVLGDNRPVSSDSRSWGMVEGHYVIGRAWLSYWPSDRIEFLHSLW